MPLLPHPGQSQTGVASSFGKNCTLLIVCLGIVTDYDAAPYLRQGLFLSGLFQTVFSEMNALQGMSNPLYHDSPACCLAEDFLPLEG